MPENWKLFCPSLKSKLTEEEAAEEAGITVEEFKKMIADMS